MVDARSFFDFHRARFRNGKLVKALLLSYTKLPIIWIEPVWWISAAAAIWLFGVVWERYRPANKNQWLSVASSALAQRNEAFDVKRFMETVYNSPLQPEFEASVREWMQNVPAKERESLFIKFIASGLVAFLHDTTWWTIFRSQFLALQELNRHAIRTETVKAEFYDRAVEQYPDEYKSDTFERWLGYLRERVLITDLPGDTIAMTQRGRDFLKHVVHYGYSATGKRL